MAAWCVLLAAAGLAGCGADPVTGPIVAADAALTVAGATVNAVGNAVAQATAPAPPPTPAQQAQTLTLAESRALLSKLSKGEKQLKDLTIAERQQVAILLAAAEQKRKRD